MWDIFPDPPDPPFGREEDEPYEDSGDREPRKPKYPPRSGGAEVEVPKEEEVLCSALG
jgi:hypothetical protein